MTAEHIEITYIDDKIDPILSKYLEAYVKRSNKKVLKKSDVVDPILSKNLETYIKRSNKKVFKYNEIEFNQEFDYDHLMNSDILKKSDVVIIDSKLYENDKTRGNNYTGEVFKLLLRDRLPYVEVIVVTQNNVSENSGTIKKATGWKAHRKYYNKNLKPYLDHYVNCVAEYRNKIKEIKKENLDNATLERIEDLLNHDDTYSLTSKDIDEIIRQFNNISKG